MKLIDQNAIWEKILKHFNTYNKRTPWSFCWRMSLESFAISFVLALFLIALAVLAGFSILDAGEDLVIGGTEFDFYLELFFSWVLLAPIIETIFLQALPVFLTKLFSSSEKWQIIVTSIVFAVPHFLIGIIPGIAAGIVGGIYFAFAYVHWRKDSHWRAFWVTALGHGINNGITFLGIVIVELLSK